MRHDGLKGRKVSGVYRLWNTRTGKSYVGRSSDINRRWRDHWRYAFGRSRKNNRLYRFMRHHGPNCWEFEVLEETTDGQREAAWVDQFDSHRNGYNATEDGGGKYLSPEDMEHTRRVMAEEVRRKISQTKLGKKTKPFSKEHKDRIGAAHKNKKCPPVGRETSIKMSQCRTGKIWVNDGNSSRLVAPGEIPPGFQPGRLFKEKKTWQTQQV